MTLSFRRTLFTMAVVAGFGGLGACTTVETGAGSFAKGFDSASLSPDANLASYDKVYIAPVKFDASLLQRDRPSRFGSEPRRVSQKDLNDRADYLERQLAREIGKTRTLVDAPGSDVLTIETRLSEVQSSAPTMTDYSDEPGLSARSIYAGGAAVSFTMRDSTGAVLASLDDEYQARFNDRPRPTGIWSDANDAFRKWAKNVARAISRG